MLVTAVISLHDDPGEWRRLPAGLRGAPLVLLATTVALVGVLAAQGSTWVDAAPGDRRVGDLFLAYRAYVQQQQGHAQVEELYDFTRALDGTDGADEVIRIVLEQAPRPAPGGGRRAGRARRRGPADAPVPGCPAQARAGGAAAGA